MRKLTVFTSALCMSLLLFADRSNAQKPTASLKPEEKLREELVNRNFIFTAEMDYENSRGIPDYSNYNLILSPSKILASFPDKWDRLKDRFSTYSFSGLPQLLTFKSSTFSYIVQEHGDSNFTVFIEPSDVKNMQFLKLSIDKNGKASLTVSRKHRIPLIYTGYIQDMPQNSGVL